ncbi:FixH family protein [Haloprofundus marisrubri]|nr:FixH family protein [Haloprofundus marisrubri]
MYARVGAVLISALLLLSGGTVVLADNPDYSISVENSVDVPDRTLTLQGTDYDVSEIGSVEPGEDIVVNADGPDGESYRVLLYNSEQQSEYRSDLQSGSSTVSFDTGPLTPGSYLALVYGPQGDIEQVQPVVVNGYDVSQSVPESTTAGESTEVTIEVSPREDAPEMNEVEVAVVAQGEATQRVTATKDGDQYVASVTFDSSGTYELYTTVRGTDTYNDRNELLALTQTQEVVVNEETTNAGSGGSSGGQDGPSDDTTTTAATTTVQPNNTTTATATTSPPSEETTTQTSSSTPSTTEPATTTSAQTDSDVITPNATSTTSSETTSTTTPGFSMLLAVVALLASICGFTLRRQ